MGDSDKKCRFSSHQNTDLLLYKGIDPPYSNNEMEIFVGKLYEENVLIGGIS